MSNDSENVALKATWNPWIGVIVALVALLGSQIIIGLVLSIYPAFEHWNSAAANNWLNNSILAQFLFVLLAEGLAIGIVYLYLRRHKNALKAIGLRRPKWVDPLYGLLGLPAYLVIYFALVNVATALFPKINTGEKQQIGFNNPHGAEALILTFISLVILPPIAEEILFRGLVYTSLRKVMPFIWAMLATSVLFAVGHLPEGGASGPLYIAAIDTFSLSLVLVYLREKTGRLYSSMTLHALKNLIAFFALFVLHLS
ncbi:MAG TPA: type II CAAX endopeptidase family protein [Candidatus Sulfotelmatobacter sp.]|nr:type II CAAX endopeptidase family protein [Candidatus Sulfotelmatobacter sp.]